MWGNPDYEPQNRKIAKLWDAVNHILTTTGLQCRTEEQVEMGDTGTKEEVVQACPNT